MSSVYVAHNFHARSWIAQEIVPFLESRGHTVTSRWLTDDSHLEHGPGADMRSAVHDLEDVERSGALIFFTKQFGDRPGRRKFVELGYAIRAGKVVILVGSVDDPGYAGCVFFRLPNVRHAADIEEAERFLITHTPVMFAPPLHDDIIGSGDPLKTTLAAGGINA